MLFPSWLEGFGLPILESMACGTPVVTSGCSAMPEVAGPAGVYVDPESAHGIATGAASLLEEAIEGGADMTVALAAVAPQIQAAVDAANRFGVPLTEDMQRLKDLAEQGVADVVTQRVVDGLEAVEVDEQHGERRALALATADGAGQLLGEQAAIR